MNFNQITFLTIMIFAGIFLLNTSAATANTVEMADIVQEGWRNAFHFEIYNKSKTPIYLALVSKTGESPLLTLNEYGVVTIGSKKKLRILNFNPQDAYTVIIKPKLLEKLQSFTFYIPANETRKNIFLTWDNEDIKRPFLRPQTGPLKGLLRKTESGLPLSGNVKQSEITPTEIEK